MYNVNVTPGGKPDGYKAWTIQQEKNYDRAQGQPYIVANGHQHKDQMGGLIRNGKLWKSGELRVVYFPGTWVY